MERVGLAALMLILNRNLRIPAFTPPCAVILRGAVRACPAIHMLGQMRLVAETIHPPSYEKVRRIGTTTFAQKVSVYDE